MPLGLYKGKKGLIIRRREGGELSAGGGESGRGQRQERGTSLGGERGLFG